MRTQGITHGPPARTTTGRAQTLTCLLPTPLLGEEHSPGSLTFTYNLGSVGEEETVQGFSTSLWVKSWCGIGEVQMGPGWSAV